MKALFTSFFNIGIAGSLLIVIAVILRLIFKRAPKTTMLFLWAVVILRLMIPFQIDSPFSVRPEMPMLNRESTAFFSESEMIPEEDVPGFLPQVKSVNSLGQSYVRVDYVEVAGYVWLAGVAAFAVYMLISYIRLKIRVREAVRIEGNIYETPLTDTAFLLGYIHPRIYIPGGMSAETQKMMIIHEQIHNKRGHNWLKLAGFLMVALHWYNPLVWVAYVLLCADIEYACDEAVVRNMTGEERKQYSTALLTCGKGRPAIVSCPVTFGESNIGGRIKKVLRYRKPIVWISVVAVTVVVLAAVFLATDPAPQYPKYYKELLRLVGQPKEVVTQELGITLGEEVAPHTGIYDTSLKVRYEDATFDVQLGFSVVDDCLWSFRYIAEYESDRNRAAQDTVDVTKRLIKTYGTAEQNINKRTLLLSEIDVPSVLDKFENRWLEHEGIDQVCGSWDLTSKMSADTRDYWDELVVSETWINMWQDKRVYPNFRLNLSAWCEPETEKCYLILDYDTGYAVQAVHTITD